MDRQAEDNDQAENSEEGRGEMGWSLGRPAESQRASPTQSTWPGSLLLGHAIPSVRTLPSLQVHLKIVSVWA